MKTLNVKQPEPPAPPAAARRFERMETKHTLTKLAYERLQHDIWKNIMVRQGESVMVRLESNPLAKVEQIDTRGKQVRESRAFTEDELKRLFAVAGRRLPAYLALLYTGMRRETAAKN